MKKSSIKTLGIQISKIKKEEYGDYLIAVGARDYNDSIVELLKLLVTKMKWNGLYVSLNKQYKDILNMLQKERINQSRILFIDSISISPPKEANIENCVYNKSPQSLTSLSLTIAAAVTNADFDFIIFDSISTLLVYNNQKTVERFTQYIISKFKAFKLTGILLMVEEQDSEKLLPILQQFCTKYIEL